MNIEWKTTQCTIFPHLLPVLEAYVGFGVYDKKGREIGALLIVTENGINYDDAGNAVRGRAAKVRTARDGEAFGSGSKQLENWGTSVEEAKAALLAEAEKMAKKARK